MYNTEPQAKAIGYCRVARKDKNINKEMLRQEELICDKAAKLDLELVDCYHEIGEPLAVLEAVYEYCETEGDIAYVIVSNISRLSRDFDKANSLVARFRDLGIEVATVEDSPIEKYVTNLNKALGAHGEEYDPGSYTGHLNK